MAIVDHNGFVRGTVGPSVFRRSGGKNIIQSKPRKHKLTANTLTSAAEFGLISSTAATIRYAFEPAFRYHDGRLNGRVLSATSKCIRNTAGTESGHRDLHSGDLSYLEGLEFNMNSPLHEAFLINPQVSRNETGEITISMPALDMRTAFKKPKALADKGYLVRIRFLLIAFNYRENFYEYVDNQEIDYYEYEKADSRQLVMNGNAPKNCLLMMSMSLSLYHGNILDQSAVLLNNTSFSPCAIIATWQGEQAAIAAVIPPIEEPKVNRIYTDYVGNRILAGLSKRIARFARRGTASTGAIKTTSETGRVEPPGTTLNNADFYIGKRVTF